MTQDDMILVSVDDHIVEPPDVFEHHIPKRWAERAPRLVYHAERRAQTWTWEAGIAATPFICAVVTLPNEEWGYEDRVGIDNIAYEVDYPHSDCSFPRSPEELWEHFQLAKCSDAEIAKIGCENALRWLRFDPFRYVPRASATVGALRAKAADVDLRTKSKADYRSDYEASHGAIA